MREHRHRQTPPTGQVPPEDAGSPSALPSFIPTPRYQVFYVTHTHTHVFTASGPSESCTSDCKHLSLVGPFLVVWAQRLSSTVRASLRTTQRTRGMSPSVGRACQRAAADLINVAYLGVFRDVALQAPLGRGFPWRIRPDASGHLVPGWI